MSEQYEIYKLLRRDKSQDGMIRRTENAKLFRAAQQKAACVGLNLRQHSEVHYSLQSPEGWRLNLYPGNLRLYHDRNLKKPPFLKVPPEWTLIDVIDAAIAATSRDFEKDIAEKIITNEQINERAYFLWEEAGRPHGEDKKFWHMAEKELRG